MIIMIIIIMIIIMIMIIIIMIMIIIITTIIINITSSVTGKTWFLTEALSRPALLKIINSSAAGLIYSTI